MLHDKATISQPLARGFDLCGRRGGGAAAPASVGAGRRDPAALTPAWGPAASRFPPPLLNPSGDPAPAGRAVPAEGIGARRPVPGTALAAGLGARCCGSAPAELPPPRARVRPGRRCGRGGGQAKGNLDVVA